jgi:hypothetical protein
MLKRNRTPDAKIFSPPIGKILAENFRRKRWALCYVMSWSGWSLMVILSSSPLNSNGISLAFVVQGSAGCGY